MKTKSTQRINILCPAALLAALLCAQSLTAQRRPVSVAPPRIEELPRVPVDTLDTDDPETKVVLYTNNMWAYVRPELEKRLRNEPALNDHWDTENLFAYRDIAFSDLPAEIDIPLIDDIENYHCPDLGRVGSKYGPRRRRNHNGVDLSLKVGEPIYATFDGRVRISQYNTGGFGNLVILRHANGLETWHGHLSRRNVETGDYVKAGQVIGYGGSTGRSTGPHLHYEVRYKDQTFDPERMIDFEQGYLRYQTLALEKSYFNINSRATEELLEDDFDISEMVDGNDSINSDELLASIEKKAAEEAAREAAKRAEVYHTVRSGDMLGRLASKYGVSIDQICRLNGINRNTVLRIGRRLRIK